MGDEYERHQLCVTGKEIMEHHRVLLFPSGLCLLHRRAHLYGPQPSSSVLQSCWSSHRYSPPLSEVCIHGCYGQGSSGASLVPYPLSRHRFLQRLRSTLCETPQKSHLGKLGATGQNPAVLQDHRDKCSPPHPSLLTSPSRKEPRTKTTPVFSGLLV